MLGITTIAIRGSQVTVDRLDKKFKASSETHQQERPSCRLTTASASILFPPECIFCEKKELKVDWKTERAVRFLSRKNRENA